MITPDIEKCSCGSGTIVYEIEDRKYRLKCVFCGKTSELQENQVEAGKNWNGQNGKKSCRHL